MGGKLDDLYKKKFGKFGGIINGCLMGSWRKRPNEVQYLCTTCFFGAIKIIISQL